MRFAHPPSIKTDMKKPVVLIASPIVGLHEQWRRELEVGFTVHEVANPAALQLSMVKLRPAILLLDRALLKFNGDVNVPAIRRLSSITKVILLASTPRVREGISVLRAGVRGYCTINVDPSLLKNAMENVQKGEIWVGRNLVFHLLEAGRSLTKNRVNTSRAKNSHVDRLTPRERDIAHLISRGASNKEIASLLNITERTVKAHITAIFQKLKLSTRLKLALFINGQLSDYHVRASRQSDQKLTAN